MTTTPQNHLWFYFKPTLLGEEQLTVTEAELVMLAKQGKINTSTKVCSITRTKNQWTTAGSVPALLKLIEQGEKERSAQKVEIAKANAQAKADMAQAKTAAKAEQARIKTAEAEIAKARAAERSAQQASMASNPHAVNLPVKIVQSSESEYEVYSANPSMFRQSPVRFVLCLMSCFLLVGIPILIIWYLKCIGTKLTITNRKSTLRHGIIAKYESEVWHKDVRQVAVGQGIFQRMMGVGNLAISSSGSSGYEIAISGIANPAMVKDMINQFKAG